MEVPHHWRLRKQRYQLQGEVCPHCEAKVFPPRPVCPHCGHGLVKTQPSLPISIRFSEPARVDR
ncbi:MAG: hypothetical protein HPY85_00010 [Anaerolineae bacterium]|nr:hypothetical protein [Anaerolineae bacterium]